MYDVDDERYLNPDNKSYRDLLSDNRYLEDRLQELEEENGYLEDKIQDLEEYYEELEDKYNELKEDYEELESAYIALESKYNELKKQEIKMIQLSFDNKTLEQENKDLKEKYNTLINKLQV